MYCTIVAKITFYYGTAGYILRSKEKSSLDEISPVEGWINRSLHVYIILISTEHNQCFQILGIVCLALASPARLPGTNWFLFVVIISFIATAIWSFVYLLSIREAINFPINWVLSVNYKRTIRNLKKKGRDSRMYTPLDNL